MSLRAQLQTFLRYFESATDETVLAVAPVWHDEEFLTGAGLFTARSTGGVTNSLSADTANGAWQLALTSTNEIQLAALDFVNQRPLALNQKLVFEARVKINSVPTSGTVAVIGLMGDHNAAVNSVAESIWFRLTGSGALTVETDDTVNETSQVATGVTIILNQTVTFRIECESIGAIRFYVDGARVASGTTFNMSQVPALALQPVLRVGKESASTAVGALLVDYVRFWQART